jgi:putative hydrolase of the HAD superfamily
MLRYALFDLDNTLYPATSGLWEAIGERMNRYMVERLGLDPADVPRRRRGYRARFGTTLKGLASEFSVDPLEFLEFVHDLPLERYLDYDAELDGMLARLPLRKVVFTNADAPHARRVLARLGLERHFERILDIHALDFVNKPEQGAYLRVLEILDARGGECVFLEDTPVNLEPARALGMRTVLVAGAPGAIEVDCRIDRTAELEAALGARGWLPSTLGLQQD